MVSIHSLHDGPRKNSGPHRESRNESDAVSWELPKCVLERRDCPAAPVPFIKNSEDKTHNNCSEREDKN